jgi:tetraacyldisaccharide 4'-kinase
MNPLSALFGAAVNLRNTAYDRGWKKAYRLKWPVVSIGNLRVGGAGKTPFTIHLGELLQERKLAFDVLSRGYRRATRGVRLVNDKGTALEFGDEPLLIAKRLGVPVIVGEDRYAAGQYAEAKFSELTPAHGGTWMHLLDDGFQHRRLARDFDIVLVTPTDATDSLLPTGLMREPLLSLRRADAVVLTENTALESLPGFLREKHVWRVSRQMEIPQHAPQRPIAFCGIARPDRFFDGLKKAGVIMAKGVQYGDHHPYAPPDIRQLLALKAEFNADGFLTTEKDILNLAAKDLLKELAPLEVVRLSMQLDQPQQVVDTILGAIAERTNGHSQP